MNTQGSEHKSRTMHTTYLKKKHKKQQQSSSASELATLALQYRLSQELWNARTPRSHQPINKHRHLIEVLYEDVEWRLYKIITKAYSTFPKLHNRCLDPLDPDIDRVTTHQWVAYFIHCWPDESTSLMKHLHRPDFISHYSEVKSQDMCWHETWCNSKLVVKPLRTSDRHNMRDCCPI